MWLQNNTPCLESLWLQTLARCCRHFFSQTLLDLEAASKGYAGCGKICQEFRSPAPLQIQASLRKQSDSLQREVSGEWGDISQWQWDMGLCPVSHNPLVRVKNDPGLCQVTWCQREKWNEACQHRLHFPSKADKKCWRALSREGTQLASKSCEIFAYFQPVPQWWERMSNHSWTGRKK